MNVKSFKGIFGPNILILLYSIVVGSLFSNLSAI